MTIVTSVAWYGVHAVGGMPQLLAALAARAVLPPGAGASDITALLPDFSTGGSAAKHLWTLPVITFVVHLAVQWLAFWYPGSEPGGGGYIAQRIFRRQGRKKRIVVGALVQPGALRTATLALDSDRARGSRSLSGLGRSRSVATCLWRPGRHRMRYSESCSRDSWRRSCLRWRHS